MDWPSQPVPKKPGNVSSAEPEDRQDYSFFPDRDRDPVFEGRVPHDSVRDDWMGKKFPRPWHISAILFVLAFGVYLATMSWTVFPGRPTSALLGHLKLQLSPAVTTPMWGWGVRLADRLPGLSVAAWMGLFSALCGALDIALVAWLMTRVGYLIRNEPGDQSFLREAQARRLSGLVAGLFLLFCMPFWVVSTRSLPDTFEALWLLLAVTAFSQYQLWGRRTYLFFFGFLFGSGMTESATFWVFLPLAIVLIAHEMYRWQALFDWRRQLVWWGGFGLGLSLYFFHILMLYKDAQWAGHFASPWAVLTQMLADQIGPVLMVRHSNGFFVVMFFCLVPWLTLYLMSRRSPWFYEWGQILVRAIFIGGLLAVLYNASFSPWNLMGMYFLVVTPYMIMAVCFGYMAGELWILGEIHLMLDTSFWRRFRRRAGSLVAMGVLPLAVLGASLHNWKQADGGQGAALQRSAESVLDQATTHRVLFAAGVLDDALRVVIRERWSPIVLISLPRISSPIYLEEVAQRFVHESLSGPLRQGDFEQFVENLLLLEMGQSLVAILDMPDLFQKYGYLLPSGFFYHLVDEAPSREMLRESFAQQQPFWREMSALVENLPPKKNEARVFLQYLGLTASKVANNFGVTLAEAELLDEAYEAFEAAVKMYPDNCSVLLNRLALHRMREADDLEELHKAVMHRLLALSGEQWSLATVFGHVWHPRQWLEEGWVWALSGVPEDEPGSRYKPAAPEEESAQLELLDQAYARWKVPLPSFVALRNVLVQNPRHTQAMVELGRLSLREFDFEVAEAYFEAAEEYGHDEALLQFDRIMIQYFQGQTEEALARLEGLSRSLFSSDIRIWLALALMTGPDNLRNAEAMRELRKHPDANTVVYMTLGAIYMKRSDWKAAAKHLEKAVSLDVRNIYAWELLLTVAGEQNNERLIVAARRALMSSSSGHYLRFEQMGIEAYGKGNLAAAEEAFRQGIQLQRHPTLLNNLAHVILERKGNLQEAHYLINEAVRRQPNVPSILVTRAQILMALGQLPEAYADVVLMLERKGKNLTPLLDLALLLVEKGDIERVHRLVELADRHDKLLTVIQRERLNALKTRLGIELKPAEEPEGPAPNGDDLDDDALEADLDAG